ncbi:M14 family metallocarboxypeptidase [Paenibacillus sp. P96]|uniref:M14 family metallocarboxypeptidase n=1 Tax=Paenibacillus zeirhizosphaerae TaxID=2987519 RepID=A0ABT9FTH8_9BACL|nr:M14 family metallocarboxypeptidase [Paenibacillus sp. P96]MDP4097767.1 M14 family metallocarboxypeptidase [Paenibacillus sp. P96]
MREIGVRSDDVGIVKLRGEYRYEHLIEDIGHLREKYNFVKVTCIGKSVMERTIPCVELGEGKHKIVVNAAMHANEWITAPCVLRFLECYAAAIADGKRLQGREPGRWLQDVTLSVVPMVNPDGVELAIAGAGDDHPERHNLLKWNQKSTDFSSWKANIRGIDLNDQFPAYWQDELHRRGMTGPGPRDYGGPEPLSEPEARALVDWTRRLLPDMAISFHTQGREIYWNYRDREPADSLAWGERLASASGLRTVKLMDSDAGYKDWFILEFGRPGFTVELGEGVNPLPLHDYDSLYRETEQVLLAALSGFSES